MSKKNKQHDPSFYRSLIREQKSKKGRHTSELIKEARNIKDPYYQSLALLRLSNDSKFPISKAKSVAQEAIQLAEDETRLWRRAELYGRLAKHAKTWNKEFSEEDSQYFLDEILKKLQEFPKGKGLSQNLSEITKYMGCSRLIPILKIALKNTDFILDDCKTIIRQWSTSCNQTIPPNKIYVNIYKLDDLFIKSKLMGYLYLQCTKKQIKFPKALDNAVDIALKTEEDKKISALRYLSRHISKKQDFIKLKKIILSLSKTSNRVQLLTTLAGHADKKNHEDFSFNLFKETLKECKKIKELNEQSKLKENIAKGLIKINQKELAKKILIESHRSANNESVQLSIEKTMQENNISLKEIKTITKKTIGSNTHFSNLPEATGCILALYDTYEGAISPIHVRTLARAAPLCAAFGLDLGLIGFPIKKPDKFIKKAITDTNIGRAGKYLKFLFEKQRIHILNCSQKSPPKFSKNDITVATTSQPDKNKKINMKKAIEKKHQKPTNKLIIIMGLGKKGLPTSILKKTDYHLELTGLDIPLETCTAMGIIAFKIHDELDIFN